MKKLLLLSVLVSLVVWDDGFGARKKPLKAKALPQLVNDGEKGRTWKNLPTLDSGFLRMQDRRTDTVQLPLKYNLKEMGFGAQGVGIIACQYLVITNTTLENIQLADMYATLPKQFTIPSPSRAMYPVNIQPRRSLTVSICFTPDRVSSYKGNLIVKRAGKMADSTVIPIWGKGIDPNDIGKLPKTGISVSSAKKGKEAMIDMTLRNQTRVVLQVMDELGNVVRSYFGNELMNPGNYQELFDGTEKGGKKLAPGIFYARFIGVEVNNSFENKMTKKFVIK